MNDIHSANYQTETSLSDVARALWRRKWIILLVVPLFIVAAYYYTQHLPKQWQADAQLLVVDRPAYGGAGTVLGYVPPASESISTQIGLLHTAAMADRALSYLKNQELLTGQTYDTGGASPGSLQGSLSASSPTDSQLINLSVLGSSHDQAVLLANAVAQSFVQWREEEASKDVRLTEARLRKEAAVARIQLEAAQRKQLAFQKGHEMLDSGSQERTAYGRLTAREDAIYSIQQEISGEEATVRLLAAQLQANNHSIKTLGPRDDALTAGLHEQLNSLQLQRQALARKVTPAFPGQLPVLDAQIQDLQARYQKAVAATTDPANPALPAQAALQNNYQAAENQLKTSQARLAQAEELKNEAQAGLAPLVQSGSVYDRIAGQAQSAAAYYSGLQHDLITARLRENQINADVQITQSAIAPDGPSKPVLQVNLLMGALLGLLASLAAIFIVEQMDRRIRTEHQVERLGSGPILGALPRLSRASLSLLNRRQLPVPVAEAYSLTGANLLRVLGTSLPGHGRLVMVTSAQPGEGKSLTAAELARSLARSGKQVILVDADMREPVQNTLFDDAPSSGLIDVLSGKILLDDALASSETPNLSVLFNNAPRSNSADIVVSPHMTNFLQMIRSRADVVVFDTPSCTFVDPLLLAPSVDYVLQVIDLGRANEDAVNSTSSVLSGLAPLGLFINRTSKKNAPAYEVARSFAATLAPPSLSGGASKAPSLSADQTLLMFRGTSGYTPEPLNGSDPLADPADRAIPLQREDH